MSMGSGGGGTMSDTRASSDDGRPMKKSACSGPAISSAKNVPRERPVIRRMTSPTRWPWLSAWYPDALPGSHHGAWAARIAAERSWSYRSSCTTGCAQPLTPEVCDIRCLTSTPSLPLAANSGQYVATGASRSSCPRSARTSAASEVIVLVVDHTLTRVFSSHGLVRSWSTKPPQKSATISPSTVSATDAPRSPPSSMVDDSTSTSLPNGSLQYPEISATAGR